MHRGITFNRTVTHTRYMKRGFWIGFDCAHYGDYVPSFAALGKVTGYLEHGQYRDFDYVFRGVTSLAQQLGP